MRGFSLLEIVIALMVLAVGMTGVMNFMGVAQNSARRAEVLTAATMLARTKMAEVLVDLEKRSAEGRFPESDETPPCIFEGAEAERFRCEVKVRKIEIPIPAGGGGEEGGAAAGIAGMAQLFMEQLKLDEAVREVKLTIFWTARGKEQHFDVVTHVVKL